VGAIEEMEEHTIQALQTLRRVLELPPLRAVSDQPEPMPAGLPSVRPVAEVA